MSGRISMLITLLICLLSKLKIFLANLCEKIRCVHFNEAFIKQNPTVHALQNIFEKTLIEVGSSHIYVSFGTFCVKIGQLFEAQTVFEKCMKTVKSPFSKENYVDFEFFRKFKASLRLD